MDGKARADGRAVRIPACSIEERDGTVTLKLEMPGVPKEALEVRIEGNELSVAGTRASEPAAGKYLLRERRTGGYRKVFTLDDTIERDGVEANLASGVLTLRLKIREAAKPRRIEIA